MTSGQILISPPVRFLIMIPPCQMPKHILNLNLPLEWYSSLEALHFFSLRTLGWKKHDKQILWPFHHISCFLKCLKKPFFCWYFSKSSSLFYLYLRGTNFLLVLSRNAFLAFALFKIDNLKRWSLNFQFLCYPNFVIWLDWKGCGLPNPFRLWM